MTIHPTMSPLPDDAPTPASRPTDRDLQRAALGELVTLATSCAADESAAEEKLAMTRSEADLELRETTQRIETEFNAAAEPIRQQHAERVAAIQQQYDTDRALAATGSEDTLARVQHETDTQVGDVERKLQHALWLAESLLEGMHSQTTVDAHKAQEAQTAQGLELDMLGMQARNLLKSYRMRVPRGEPAPRHVPATEDAVEAYKQRRKLVQHLLAQLEAQRLPRLFVGIMPILILLLLLIVAVVAAQVLNGKFPPSSAADLAMISIKQYALWTAGGAIGLGLLLKLWSDARVRKIHVPFMQAMSDARQATVEQFERAQRERDERLDGAQRQRDADTRAARDKYEPLLLRAKKHRESVLTKVKHEADTRLAQLDARRDTDVREAGDWQKRQLADLVDNRDASLKAAKDRHARRHRDADAEYAQTRSDLEQRWNDGLRRIQAPIDQTGAESKQALPWTDPAWRTWQPSDHFASTVRFGELKVDLPQITHQVPRHLKLPESFSMPAYLAFPRQASLLIQHERTGRAAAIGILQATMARLLTTLPPGRVRFTILDPVGLGQNFAGFMHLADYDDALVDGRIWTDAEQIQSRLVDLTEHMETVIQKYLRNEFETIDDYNAQAGELAEPYRFLVIADLPVNFSDESLRRLASIASSGPRCGVYTLVSRDLRLPLPSGSNIDELESNSVNLVQEEDRFVWKDEVFLRFPLTLDGPPPEETLTHLLNVVGERAKDASRVEVSFSTIAPSEDQLWTGKANDELRVPIGRLGATRLQQLRLGRGVAQHALIAGKTGSGKSTLLHALITNVAMWYSPDEVELYLVDFKKGVEFKTYATYALPHARAVAVESDREFGLSVLQRLDQELTRRGTLFRAAGVQDLAAYRRSPSAETMPRTLLIIDEFQEFFSEDDKLAQEASLLLDRLVRQGRAFGIHVLLGSQTIGGSSGLPRSTIGQMAVRLALQTSEADSQLILGDNNSAARLLRRPGEAIYNDQGGLVEANSPFQVAWLPDEQRERYLSRVRSLDEAYGNGKTRPPAAVFEGNAPADVRKNELLTSLLHAKQWPGHVPAPRAWLGEPVAIKDPTSIPFRRQGGANVLIIGQQDDAARGILTTALLSIAVQQSSNAARFYILDGTPVDSPQAGEFDKLQSIVPHEVTVVPYRGVEEAMNTLNAELQRRQNEDDADAPSIYVMVFGLQRYRVLRRQEDSFSFSMDESNKGPSADRIFASLLREGPALGMHVIAWCDTPVALDRTLDRASMREFDHRILFQMSATDSANLIDSPAANKLGPYRALAYSEEQGTVEKFRPYAPPPLDWLTEATASLRSRQ